MSKDVSSPVETQMSGSFATRFLLELFGNSAHFPIANILLELLIEKPLEYLRAPDLYVLLTAGTVQAYWLTRWQTSPRPRRLWGNLIGPVLYTSIESAFEGLHFFSAPHHLAYWVFALAIGILQEARPRLPVTLQSAILVLENIVRTAILFFMYAIFENYANPEQTASLSAFFEDASHQFIALAVLFFGFNIGLANLMAEYYHRLLAEKTRRQHEQRLRELIEVAPFGAHLYELRPDNRLIFVSANAAAQTIVEADSAQLTGKTLEKIFPSLKNSELSTIFRLIAALGGRHHAQQMIIQKPDGSEGYYNILAVQIAPNQLAVFFHDITELTRAYDMTLEGWSRAMDLRDHETEGHTQRVTALAVQLARAMGLNESEIVHIRRGALLHDIGKMAVPDDVLFKTDTLSEADWILMRQHPQFAYDMLSPITFLHPALEIPYAHHEKWNGTGYPRGLKGEEIPLAARIFAVVDVYDALRFGRRYHSAWSEQKVREYLREQSGKHFDPRVVETFLKLLEEGQITTG